MDVARFAAEGAQLEGQWPGAELDRLAQSQSAPQDLALAPVHWRVTGEARPMTGAEDQCWLHLEARTSVWLTCQRCLRPLAIALQVDSWIRFVQGEAEAEALDAESEEDVLALARALDLQTLIEDELLLALPLVPRHEACPQPLQAPAAVAEPADGAPGDSPFAVLRGLAIKSSGHGPSGT